MPSKEGKKSRRSNTGGVPVGAVMEEDAITIRTLIIDINKYP